MTQTTDPSKGARMTLMIQLGAGAGAIGIMIFALPSFLLFGIAMLPTLGAYVADENDNRSLTHSVGFLNFAGAWPFLLKLWTGANSLLQSAQILTDPYAWLLIYSAAALGWLFYLAFPTFSSAMQNHSAGQRARKFRRNQERLEAIWGQEVLGRKAASGMPPA